jgi:hypothetical protein
VLVVGAGIAGLAAARAFARAGVDDVQVLELEDQPGGNSRSHVLGGMACPLGAHYLPLPAPESHEVAEWLHESGLLRYELGRTVADERHLCHSPQERLFIEGAWAEGLLPPAEPGSATAAQYRRFAQAVAQAQRLGARAARRAFAQPAHRSAWTPELAALDGQTFSAWLAHQGLNDPHLRWYLDYCCRDDYGAGLETVSAWAGIHYFASRHGFQAPARARPKPSATPSSPGPRAMPGWRSAWPRPCKAACTPAAPCCAWKNSARVCASWPGTKVPSVRSCGPPTPWCWPCRCSSRRACWPTRLTHSDRPPPCCNTPRGWWPMCTSMPRWWTAPVRHLRGTTWSTASAAWAMWMPSHQSLRPMPAPRC